MQSPCVQERELHGRRPVLPQGCEHMKPCEVVGKGGQRAAGSACPSPALQGIADCSNLWSLTLESPRRGLAEVVCSTHSDDAQSSALHQSEGGAKEGRKKG